MTPSLSAGSRNMLFGWFRRRKRKRLLKRPFPEQWTHLLEERFALWSKLSGSEQTRLKRSVQILVAEKNWEGCGGLAITEEIKVLVSVQIALLGLGIDELYFDRVLSILIYPDAYRVPGDQNPTNFIQTEGGSPRMGEAWWGGPVILSWRHALAGATGDSVGENLVLHEFAHQIDMLNGRTVDGTPPLETREQLERWIDGMTAGYHQLTRACHHREHTALSCYGTTNVGEFFAVATESFFTQPLDLRIGFPIVYDLLVEFYRQDPAARLTV